MRSIFDTTDEHGDPLPNPAADTGIRVLPPLISSEGEAVTGWGYYFTDDDPADSLPVIRATLIA